MGKKVPHLHVWCGSGGDGHPWEALQWRPFPSQLVQLRIRLGSEAFAHIRDAVCLVQRYQTELACVVQLAQLRRGPGADILGSHVHELDLASECSLQITGLDGPCVRTEKEACHRSNSCTCCDARGWDVMRTRAP
jgi:hypothetical protein